MRAVRNSAHKNLRLNLDAGFQAIVGQAHAEAISISPLVGFQHATVETLERFRRWRVLRNRPRTEADEQDQERKY